MPIKAVLFDCDGVLVDSEPLSKRLLVDMLLELGIEGDPDALLVSFSGRRMADCLRDIESWSRRRLPEDFVPRYREREYRMLTQEVLAVEGIHEAIDRLALPIAVASNGPLEKIRVTLGATGLLPRFGDHVYSAYDVGAFKPDPALYLYAADKLGVAPGECAVVEDSVFGARAGVAAGMRVVGYGAHVPALEEIGAIGLDEMARLPELLATFG